MPGTRSSAATKCISLVPGLAKQVSTPDASSVRTRVSAPFKMGSSMLLLAGGRGQPREGGAPLRFECRDGVAIFQRHVDVIDAADQAILAQRADVEAMRRTVRRHHRLVRKVDGERRAGACLQLPPQVVDR